MSVALASKTFMPWAFKKLYKLAIHIKIKDLKVPIGIVQSSQTRQ